MLRLLSSIAKGRKDIWKPSKPCHVGVHWIALVEFSQMSTHVPGSQTFFRYFALAKLTTSSIGVETVQLTSYLVSNDKPDIGLALDTLRGLQNNQTGSACTLHNTTNSYQCMAVFHTSHNNRRTWSLTVLRAASEMIIDISDIDMNMYNASILNFTVQFILIKAYFFLGHFSSCK